jgi:hypothetical protein
MNLFKRIYWWALGWRTSIKVMAEILREGYECDWDENQAAEIHQHRMKQWAKANLPQELQ